jgi:hydrogenase/urease accessory protein HupE
MSSQPGMFERKRTKQSKRSIVPLVISVCCCSILFLLASSSVSAHEVRPAYLELRQTGAETFDALWKVPARGDDLRLGLYVEFPPGTANLTTPRVSIANNASIERWSVKRAGGFTGGTIHIAGLAATMTDVLVRVERLDGTTQVTRLASSNPSFIVAAVPGAVQVAATYGRLGVEHILTGIDHLLYILAMLFLVKGWKRIVATMSAFTATHSLTLTAAALGWVHVPQPPVEACIALSILFVTREIICVRQGRPGLTARWPWVVSFTFGLLHGFGFAGALAEVGLPQSAIPVALLFFNLGVEVGQLLFIASVLALAVLGRQLARQIATTRSAFAWQIPPYAIGGVAAFWLIQRTLSFVQ